MQATIERWRRRTLDSIYRVPSVAALEALPADTVFARYQRWWGRSLEPGRENASMRMPVVRYLGHVIADDSTAYGVMLETYEALPDPDAPREQLSIMTFRRFGAGWRSMLDAGMTGGSITFVAGDDACR
jgi:hypothetical protein